MKNGKKVKHKKSFKIPIFNRWISIFIGQDKPECEAYVYERKGNIHAVFRENVSDDIIVHECVHIVSIAFTLVGQKGDLNNDELQAYLTQYLFKKIKKILNGKNI